MKSCDEVERRVTSEIKNRTEHSNITNLGNCVISVNNELMEIPIREAMRTTDVTMNESN